MTFKKTFIALLLIACSGMSQADTENKSSHMFAGLKLGKFLIDVSDIDDADAVGFMAGYDFGEGFALQLEYLSGDTDYLGVDIDVESIGGYGVFRSKGPFYIMGKLGIIREELKASNGSLSISEDDSGSSLGIGGGFRAGDKFGLELEYTLIEEDMDFFGASAYLRF